MGGVCAATTNDEMACAGGDLQSSEAIKKHMRMESQAVLKTEAMKVIEKEEEFVRRSEEREIERHEALEKKRLKQSMQGSRASGGFRMPTSIQRVPSDKVEDGQKSKNLDVYKDKNFISMSRERSPEPARTDPGESVSQGDSQKGNQGTDFVKETDKRQPEKPKGTEKPKSQKVKDEFSEPVPTQIILTPTGGGTLLESAFLDEFDEPPPEFDWEKESAVPLLLTEATSAVHKAVFSPNSKYIACALEDNTLMIWTSAGRHIKTLSGHTDSVLCCAFTSRSISLLSCSKDKSLKLWDLKGKCRQTFVGHSAAVTCCDASADGIAVISGSVDKTLKLWNMSGSCIKTFKGHQDEISSCAFCPNGKHFVSASLHGTMKVWNVEGQCQYTGEGHVSAVHDCSFSPNGKHVLTASEDKNVQIREASGTFVMSFHGDHPLYGCKVAPDGEHVLTISSDGKLKIWSWKGECIVVLQNPAQKDGRACDFSEDGKKILSASSDGSICIWTVK